MNTETTEATQPEVEQPKPENKIFSDPTTFERAWKLLKKVQWLNKAIVKNPTVPILENLLFDRGAITATDLHTSAMHYTDIKGTFLMPAKKLEAILKKCNKEDVISFKVNPENYMVEILIDGESTFNIAGENVKDFPKLPVCDQIVGEIQGPDDFETMFLMKDYISRDELRPVICCIRIANETLAATNGHWLVTKPTKHLMLHEPEFYTLIGRRAIEMMKDFKHATIKTSEREDMSGGTQRFAIMFKETERAVVTRHCEEKFPDYTQVIPTYQNIILKVDRKTLTSTIDLALETANTNTHQIRLKLINNHNQLIVSSEDLDFKQEFKKKVLHSGLEWKPWKEQELYAIDKEGNEVDAETYKATKYSVDYEMRQREKLIEPTEDQIFEIGFNGKFLLDILKDITEPQITLELAKPNKAAMINRDFLLMPVMLTDFK
jgi:DNA polymerase-3 subunit beta